MFLCAICWCSYSNWYLEFLATLFQTNKNNNNRLNPKQEDNPVRLTLIIAHFTSCAHSRSHFFFLSLPLQPARSMIYSLSTKWAHVVLDVVVVFSKMNGVIYSHSVRSSFFDLFGRGVRDYDFAKFHPRATGHIHATKGRAGLKLNDIISQNVIS